MKSEMFLLGLGVVLILASQIIISGRQVNIRQIKKCAGCNVVLISIDTLRAGNVGWLGYGRNTTPNLDKLTKTGFVFANSVSASSWTLPSHMSWFTGVYPSRHKITNKYVADGVEDEIANLGKMSPNLVTLAEVLKKNGYRTGGFTGGAGVDRQFGFDRGFETYFDKLNFGGFSDSIPLALKWIGEHKDEPAFIFLHGYDVHGQYVPEGGYDKRFVDFEYKGKLTGSREEQKELREEGLELGRVFLSGDDVRFLVALYDEKIQRVDARLGQFFDEYRKLGLWDRTVFVITSDHGEEFYEHGGIDHGHSLYEEQIHVPLLIVLPGEGGVRILDQVSSVDLMPTILDLVGVTSDEELQKQMEGESLVSVMAGSRTERPVFAETDYRYAVKLRSVRDSGSWKLIVNLMNSGNELFNLRRDSQESENKAGVNKNKVEQMRGLLRKFGVR